MGELNCFPALAVGAVVLFFSTAGRARAQEVSSAPARLRSPTSYAVFWGGTNESLTDGWGVSLWELYATKVNFSLTALEFSYKLDRNLSLTLGFAHADFRPDGFSSTAEERARSAFTLHRSFGRLRLELRQLFEGRFGAGHHNWRYRPKIGASVRIGGERFPWRAFAWEEGYHETRLGLWETWMSYVGGSFPVGNHVTVDLGYIIQNKIGTHPVNSPCVDCFYKF